MSHGGKQREGKKMHSLKPPSNISAFLSKLWRMVNDSEVDLLISWNDAGSCFVIQNQYQFWAELLPLYYKHNNMASFVRQLNMYGFHKVTSDLGLSDSDLQFYHEYFQRDKPELLEHIKRKVAVPRASAAPPPPTPSLSTAPTSSTTILADLIGSSASPVNSASADPINRDKEELARVLTDVKDIQGRQSSFNSQLAQLKHENSVLWSELAILRQRHTKQQAIVNKLIHFLVTLVQTPNSANRMGVKRTFPLMIDHDTAAKKSKTAARRRARAHSLRIHELDPTIGEAIDEDSVITLETVASQHTAPTKIVHEFSPNEFLHSPEQRDNGNVDVEDVVIDESSALVDELLDTDDNEIVVLPSEIKSPSGSDIPSTSNTEFEVYVDENSNDDDDDDGLFLNPTASNKLITSLMNGSYNSNAITDTLRSKLAASGSSSAASPTTLFANYSSLFPSSASETVPTVSSDILSGACSSSGTADNLAVATMPKPPKPARLKSVVGDELGQHLKDTQSELECIKDIIYGNGSMDLNYLLGLFNEDPPFKLVPPQADPSMSNTISTYEPISSPIDFTELMNSINSDADPLLPISIEEESAANDSSSINTPLIFEGAPIYPNSLQK